MADIRAALQELHDAIHEQFFSNDTGLPPRLINACNEAGRLLPAQPEVEGLTDEELWDLFCPFCREDFGNRFMNYHEFCKGARAVEAAVLARWGRPTPQPPADGEVAELVEFLQRHGSAQEAADTHWAKPMLRAAELLQRQHPQPPADGEVEVELSPWGW